MEDQTKDSVAWLDQRKGSVQSRVLIGRNSTFTDMPTVLHIDGFPLTISQEKVGRHFFSFSFAPPQLHNSRLQDAVPQVVYDKEEAGQEDEAKQAYSPLDPSSYRQHYQVQCQAQALAQNQARILSESSRLFVFCSI
ncbi:unnamed protein product [Brassica rapa subsp. narinosa]